MAQPPYQPYQQPYPQHPQYPERSSYQTQSIVLIVLGFLCGVMVPAILGIIALVKLDDPHTARQLVKWGWISYAGIMALVILSVIAYFVIMLIIPLVVYGAAGSSY
jgi:hypothetical protein